MRPPAGCPQSKPNTYYLLKKTLYGLKRSPRHWYHTAKRLLAEIGLHTLPNSKCIFVGTPIPGKPPLYLGLYVDDFVYFSESSEVEKHFEKQFSEKTTVDFMGEATHFLGIKIQQQQTESTLTIHLSQPAFTEQLLTGPHLNPNCNPVPTPYRSGLPVDAVPTVHLPHQDKQLLIAKMRSIIGSLIWLSQATRPDISTITNMLAKYQANPSPGHLVSAQYVLKYLKGTIHKGIRYSSEDTTHLSSFLKFPLDPTKLTAQADANWGPQDASVTSTNMNTPQHPFKSRSVSGYLLWLGGPLHWSSKRQKITARSSAEAEIYATDECVKQIQYLRNIIHDMHTNHLLLSKTTTIYNDNMACVHWSQSMTTKGLRHIQMRENAIREEVYNKHIKILHIEGKVNMSDLFTKEDKDRRHFKTIVDLLLYDPIISL
jgi:hypothetical protein